MRIVATIPETLATLTTIGPQDVEKWARDNGQWLYELLAKHKRYLDKQNVALYQAAYDGEMESITERDKSRGDDVNHKVVPNHAAIIIDTVVDYLLGKPIVWAFEDRTGAADKETLEAFKSEFLSLFDKEDAQLVLREQLTQGCIASQSAILCWTDEDGNIDFDEFPVSECIAVFDSRGRLKMFIRHYEVEEQLTDYAEGEAVVGAVIRHKMEVYDDKYITFYKSGLDGVSYELDTDEPANPVMHGAARIPVSLYINGGKAGRTTSEKRDGTSDLASGAYDLIEEYANGFSDKANTVDRIQDQYLKLRGVETDEDEVVRMRKARALALRDPDSDASYIAPDQQDGAVENFLDRLRDEIYETTFTPRLNNISGTTATEIKVKYAGLEIKAGRKVLYFTKSLKQLIAVITDMINMRRLTAAGVSVEAAHAYLKKPETYSGSVKLYRAEWAQFTINRNMPQNFLELAQIVAQLADIVPKSFLYEILWFIDDPAAAQKEWKEEQDSAADRQSKALFGSQFAGTDPIGGTGAEETPENR